ncbi:hypothetical protein M378DRAFT_670412 [Amanita muscaria Koide BX008]|uniref:Uncharacterized protein n=1 Tax=Amanita muscaria (strain Koide BX008) TaxID=946122 RepID=A0A0C2SJQ9_AMAMK|nr:hypothetical protein M378DRAFT_670412 [Amanita muscaria Koide BX008]
MNEADQEKLVKLVKSKDMIIWVFSWHQASRTFSRVKLVKSKDNYMGFFLASTSTYFLILGANAWIVRSFIRSYL